jgi:uncharacterized integral membrane protein
MKLSWIFVMLLLAVVAIFSAQNSGVITVEFLVWKVTASAALVIQLAALLGAFVGLMIGALSRRRRKQPDAAQPARGTGPDATQQLPDSR